MARQLQLVIQGFSSTISEADAFILSQMEFLGDGPMISRPASQLGPLTDERAVPPLFRFLRYDVRLESRWLKEQLDMDISEEEVAALRTMDDPASSPRLYEIGTIAAGMQIKAEHWLPRDA